MGLEVVSMFSIFFCTFQCLSVLVSQFQSNIEKYWKWLKWMNLPLVEYLKLVVLFINFCYKYLSSSNHYFFSFVGNHFVDFWSKFIWKFAMATTLNNSNYSDKSSETPTTPATASFDEFAQSRANSSSNSTSVATVDANER